MHLILVPLGLMLLGGRRLARWSMQLALAWCLAWAAAIAIDGVALATPFLAMLLFLPAIALVRGLWRRGRPRGLPGRPHRPATTEAIPADDWRELRRALGWSGGRLDAVRDVFGRFLALADASPFSPDTEELVILIRKRAPELIARALADCRTASRDERRQRLGETVDALERLAGRAEARRAWLWREQGAAFETRRSHLTGRIAPDPLASI